jgi:hypothetical protein
MYKFKCAGHRPSVPTTVSVLKRDSKLQYGLVSFKGFPSDKIRQPKGLMYVLLKGYPAILKKKPALEPGRDAVEARIVKPLRIGIIPT